MGAAIYGVGQLKCICLDLGEDLRGDGLCRHALRLRDVGNETTHQQGFGWIPPQGGPQADMETTMDRTG